MTDDETFGVYEDNGEIVAAFLTVQSQFRRGGFRYEGVRAGLRMAGIPCSEELFRGLRTMELAVLSYLGERDD